MKVFLTALGCRLNQAEADRFAEQFTNAGYGLTSTADDADLAIIHTCTVTHVADKKSRQVIRQTKRANPNALVMVSGCYAETSPGEVAGLPEVDLVVSQRDKARIVDLAADIGARPNPIATGLVPHPLPLPASRSRAFVKIQDGCNDFCTYCIIPYSRGRVQSEPTEAIIEDIKRKMARGATEVVLTGVSIGAYGHDRGPKRATTSLPKLVEAILTRTEVQRLRISSLEPHDFEPAMADFFADPRLCNHLHLCLQSGSDGVLRRMRRRYSTAEYAGLIDRLRAQAPSIGLTTDVIAGFPGETDGEFAETMAFIERIRFSGLHVFRYSPREGTRAANFPDQVPPEESHARAGALIALGGRLAHEFRSGQVGTQQSVLFESRTAVNGEHGYAGLTGNYLRTFVTSPLPLTGQVRPVRLTGEAGEICIGQLAEEAA